MNRRVEDEARNSQIDDEVRSDEVEWLNSFRLGMEVKRCHSQPVIREYTNGHHTTNAIAIARCLCHLNGLIHYHATDHLLVHDAPECFVGDIPANFKKTLGSTIHNSEERWMNTNLPKYMYDLSFSVREACLIKMSDMLELMWWCVEEKEMGNGRIEGMYSNIEQYIKEHHGFSEAPSFKRMRGVREIHSSLSTRWRKA